MTQELPTDPPDRPVQWELVIADDAPPLWRWRRLASDGTVEQSSEAFGDFGKAMSNALAHGFLPKLQHWVIRNATWTTHFPVGEQPVIVTRTDSRKS